MKLDVNDLGNRIIAQLKEDLGPKWEQISQQAKNQLTWAAKTTAMLTLRSLKGEDMAHDLAGVESLVANWSYVHASTARRAFWGAVDKTVGIAGQFVGGIAAGALGRIV